MERQELYCHNCARYVQFDIDPALNGQHVIPCPNCGHEHLRYVQDGIISDRRWGSRNAPLQTYTASSVTYTTTSTYTAVITAWNVNGTSAGSASTLTVTDNSGRSYVAGLWLQATSAST